jgi:sugar transferase EpsL
MSARSARLLDLVAGGAALAAAAPLLLGVGLAVGASMGRPVLFRQRRPGRDGVPFELLKFRTMRAARSDEEEVASDGARITKLGALLRRTSLDELPELLNVLRGEMSLVGPRPLLMQYLGRYDAEQARRHEVRPGITGWAQVHGRNAVSWDDRLAMDVWYVDHRSLALDLKILAKTLLQVARADGIEHEGSATMPEFMGSGG